MSRTSADVEGSTRLWAADSDAMSASLLVHDRIMRGTIESHGCYVFTTAGDSVAAAFARASDAVAAASLAQRELATAAWRSGPALCVRMRMHIAEAEERGGDYFEPVANTAARVEAAGHGGQVLMTAAVRTTARVEATDLGVHQLRDVDEPVHLQRAVNCSTSTGCARSCWERCRATRPTRPVALIGASNRDRSRAPRRRSTSPPR